MMKSKFYINLLIFCSILIATTDYSYSARIKDIASFQGVHGVQIIGYGLVSGLNNTGDNQQSSFSIQSVSNMLKRFGLTVPEANPRIRNIAAVMLTATIPAFSKKGSKIDIQVSSMGDATSLQGGILLMTPMSLSDGTISGMAQGALSIGGYDYQAFGSRVTRNVVTTGLVPNGLILEIDIPSSYSQNSQLRINLKDPDFTTASRVSQIINGLTGLTNSAMAIDAATIQVQLPAGQTQDQVIQTISQIESQNVISDPSARVVINERTGTIVIGGNVQLLPVVIAHGSLEISIQKQVQFQPPSQFSVNNKYGQPAETGGISTQQKLNQAQVLQVNGATVQDMAAALNTLKVSSRDLIEIFQALKASGALMGEIVIQ